MEGIDQGNAERSCMLIRSSLPENDALTWP